MSKQVSGHAVSARKKFGKHGQGGYDAVLDSGGGGTRICQIHLFMKRFFSVFSCFFPHFGRTLSFLLFTFPCPLLSMFLHSGRSYFIILRPSMLSCGYYISSLPPRCLLSSEPPAARPFPDGPCPLQVLFFVISAVKSGDAAGLAPTIVPLLHPIMAVQEVSDQDFALLAKQALAYLKYLPLPGSSLPGTAREIVAACGAANWHTRAAALVFLQAFAYRHSFLLEGEDAHRLREAVLQLLADSQLEVRGAAGGLL